MLKIFFGNISKKGEIYREMFINAAYRYLIVDYPNITVSIVFLTCYSGSGDIMLVLKSVVPRITFLLFCCTLL